MSRMMGKAWQMIRLVFSVIGFLAVLKEAGAEGPATRGGGSNIQTWDSAPPYDLVSSCKSSYTCHTASVSGTRDPELWELSQSLVYKIMGYLPTLYQTSKTIQNRI
jgi:hypothetical protein